LSPAGADGSDSMTSEPSSVRAVRFPAAYGTPGGPDSLLPWSYVEKRLRAASNYWITTLGRMRGPSMASGSAARFASVDRRRRAGCET
jgi:hypothetical protein